MAASVETLSTPPWLSHAVADAAAAWPSLHATVSVDANCPARILVQAFVVFQSTSPWFLQATCDGPG